MGRPSEQPPPRSAQNALYGPCRRQTTVKTSSHEACESQNGEFSQTTDPLVIHNEAGLSAGHANQPTVARSMVRLRFTSLDSKDWTGPSYGSFQGFWSVWIVVSRNLQFPKPNYDS